MNLHCIIVDDEPLARKVLREYVEDAGFLSLAGEAENPIKARHLLDTKPVDLIFLDINMPKLSGIEFLRSSKSLPMTIMTTAYAEHALDGFELDVIDYLVKPFSFERFLKASHKAREYHLLNHPPLPPGEIKQDHFFVKCDGRLEKLLYSDLVYVEAMLNYVILHTSGGGRLIVYLTMKSILEQLPPALFLKVHKSYIINLAKVKSIEGNLVHVDGATIPVSQQYYEQAVKTIVKDRLLRR
ncbi:MAG TPA: LytTR family DNA-binding domain-containing protein [Chitinophagaceae bacterium]|nr:LytTR family DNA-binding domain-containing protein [Chitinophagaceae bacterium]